MDRQLPDGNWSSGRVNSCKVSPSLIVYPAGQMSNPSLEWKKADVFKINGDDDLTILNQLFLHKIN